METVKEDNEGATSEQNQTENDLRYSEDMVENTTGVKLYHWQYEPTNVTKPRGLLFLSHGFCDHAKRFDEFARLLCSELGCIVIGHDHIGHGRSEGERAFLDNFDVLVIDFLQHIDQVKKSYTELPVFIIGTSMGGLVAMYSTCERPNYITGIVLCAPSITLDEDIDPGSFKKFLGRIISSIFPNMVIQPSPDPIKVTSDEEQANRIRNDPFVWKGGVKARTGQVILDTMDHVREQLIPTVHCPFLVLHGDQDKTTCIGGSELLMKNAASVDKEMKTYSGLKHNLIHETRPQRDQVISDIVEWLRKRIVTL